LTAQCPDGSPPPCRLTSHASTAPAPNSVAVLYFDNLSADTADAYLAEGLTEELIARLGQLPRLAVKSRAAVQRFRQSGADPLAAARSEEHTSELQSPCNLVCRLLLEKKKKKTNYKTSTKP